MANIEGRELDFQFWDEWLAGRIDGEAALRMSLEDYRNRALLERALTEPDMIARLDNWHRQQRQMTVDAELDADLAEWDKEPRW